MGDVSDRRFAKERSGAKDSLEAVHKTAISIPAFEQSVEIADFGRGPQAHETTARLAAMAAIPMGVSLS
jgi:hypothetical protein